MPMGAVITVDYFVFGRFGLIRDFAERSGSTFNVAAGSAWLIALLTAGFLNRVVGVQIYFLALPGWLTAGILYIVLSTVIQRRWRHNGVLQ
jgi:hypothetical protein